MYKLFFLFISLETYIKSCKTNKDCYNCTSNFQKNCLWKLNECEKNNDLKNNINKQDWWNSFLNVKINMIIKIIYIVVNKK